MRWTAGWATVAALLSMQPSWVEADPLEAVNWARTQGCAQPSQARAGPPAAAATPLRYNRKLNVAAQGLAGGASVHSAMSAAGYVAASSTVVHLSGAPPDGQLGRVLSVAYCASLTDRSLTEFGAERRGRDLWMLLAAPVWLPLPADAKRVERQILAVVNEARRQGRHCGDRLFPAAAPLSLNASLYQAALAHSTSMARYGAFDHRGHDGSSPAMRVERAGYGEHRLIGENIAAGAMRPAELAQGWLQSAAHCENIMDPRFSETGIAFAVNTTSWEIVYWTEDFGAPRGPRN